MPTLLERAKAMGATITRAKLGGYAIYRVRCSACHAGIRAAGDLPSSNYDVRAIRSAMNDHARKHLEGKERPVKRKPKRTDPPWYQRLQRTVKLKQRIAEIVSEWPTDGTSCTDQEMDVDDAFTAWNRDMGELPE